MPRLVPYMIREASTCSKCGQIQRQQADIMHREEPWEHSSKGDIPIKYSPTSMLIKHKEEEAGVRGTEGMENKRRTRPAKSNEQSSYELTETQVAITGLNWPIPYPLNIYDSFQMNTFIEILNVQMSWSLILVPAIEALSFFYCLVLSNLDMMFFLYFLLFVMFYFYLLKDCSF